MSNMSDMVGLASMRCCIQKPLRSDEHALHSLKINANSEDHYNRLRAAFFIQKMWPKKATITISFYPRASDRPMASWTPIDVMKARREPDGSAAKLDPIEDELRGMSLEDGVKKVVEERIAPICGLNFVFVNGNGNVRIGFDAGGGSWSMVGTDCLKTDKKTMNFGWLDAATIMHEFGHVLGMIHEHQNPRGNTIKWNVPVVDAWAQQTQNWDKETTYNNIIKHYSVNQINGSQYDPSSIMLYYFPAKMTLNNKGTDMNLRMSGVDVEWIQKMYPGGSKTPSAFFSQAYNESLSEAGIGGGKNRLLWLIPLIIVAILIVWWLGKKAWMWRAKRTGRYG